MVLVAPAIAGSVQTGDLVQVAANEYGRNGIQGELRKWSANEVAILREDTAAGSVMVYFPSQGFEVR